MKKLKTPATMNRVKESKVKKPPRLSVILPTYNEVDNIEPAIQEVANAVDHGNYEIIFVDDNSPDGTADKVRQCAKKNEHIKLIVRKQERGLSGAIIAGLSHANAPLAVVMDSDLQHDTQKIAAMENAFRQDPHLDLVIGSRFGQGSMRDGFSRVRAFYSWCATLFSRLILQKQITDPLSGFFMMKTARFHTVANKLQHQGFKVLYDILSWAKGWKVGEVYYDFRKRHKGDSKFSAYIFWSGFSLVISRFLNLPYTFVMYAWVGLSGTFIHLGSTWLLLNFLHWPYLIANTTGVLLAMGSNFTLNNRFTFRNRQYKKTARWLNAALGFYIVCGIGAGINILVANFLQMHVNYWYLASIGGITIAAIWNYGLSSLIIWRAK